MLIILNPIYLIINTQIAFLRDLSMSNQETESSEFTGGMVISPFSTHSDAWTGSLPWSLRSTVGRLVRWFLRFLRRSFLSSKVHHVALDAHTFRVVLPVGVWAGGYPPGHAARSFRQVIGVLLSLCLFCHIVIDSDAVNRYY